MKQTNRPAQITSILNAITTEYSAKLGASLETYISYLELNQQNVTLPQAGLPSDPIWSHQRRIKRELKRRERTSRERNNYH